jgi:glycosyltransferase involved in cell wall biosynthesis
MTILFFGTYNSVYSRNRVLLHGFKENGVGIIECKTEFGGFKKYIDLFKKHKKYKNQYDLMFVAFPGQLMMIFAKFLTKKKIIFDAFTSLYDSNVFDRRTVKKNSLKAKYYWFLDWFSCSLADKILLDTNEHVKYFLKTFKIKEDKFIRLFVVADDVVFKNAETKTRTENQKNKFLVHFHGTYIPLQGLETVLETARLLEKEEDIRFNIIGSKIKEKFEKQNFKNVDFTSNVNYEDLFGFIAMSDISLGIFGETEKAKRVIPNKVYEAIAMNRPIITGRSEAIKELFEDKKNILMCDFNNAEDLADKILELKNNKDLRLKLSCGVKELNKKLIPKNLVKELIKEINNF